MCLLEAKSVRVSRADRGKAGNDANGFPRWEFTAQGFGAACKPRNRKTGRHGKALRYSKADLVEVPKQRRPFNPSFPMHAHEPASNSTESHPFFCLILACCALWRLKPKTTDTRPPLKTFERNCSVPSGHSGNSSGSAPASSDGQIWGSAFRWRFRPFCLLHCP